MKQFLKKRKGQGFTLVELLIVIVIIGILAGSLLLVMGSGTDKANATKVVSDMRTLKAASLMYYADNDDWPETVNDLGDYLDRGPNASSTLGTYSFSSVASGDTVWVLFDPDTTSAIDDTTGFIGRLNDFVDDGVLSRDATYFKMILRR